MPSTNTQALALIQQCQDEQSDFLDLGNLGLTQIPEEVYGLKHLKGLNLGTHYFAEGEWKRSKNEGNTNFISELEVRLSELGNLEALTLAKNPITECQLASILPKLKVLDLSYTQIKNHHSIFELKHLQVLRLSGNRLNDLSFLPAEPYLSLEELDISHNNLHTLADLIVFPNLKILNASINFLQNTQDFPLLPALQELYLGGNFLEEADGLNQLVALEKVSLGFLNMDVDVFWQNRPRNNSNFLLKWPVWENLNKLHTIDLQGNFLSKIPDLAFFPNLEVLCLGQNKLSGLGGIATAKGLKVLTLGNRNPSRDIYQNYQIGNDYPPLQNTLADLYELRELKSLEKLFLDNLQLKEIPELSHHKQLTHLNLSENQISEIKNLDNLAQLQSLSLSSNQISEIKNLDNLAQLQSLDLYSNQISEIKNLENLALLQSLDLNSNQISEIKNLDNLAQLQSLYLYSNQISEIKNLDNLAQLQSLYLSSNQISEIKNLDNLAQLQSLFLSSNQISEIKNLQSCLFLQNLDLSNNQIEHLKTELAPKYLLFLGLSDNKIAQLYEPLLHHPYLRSLNFSNNPVVNIASELTNQENCLEDARNWFNDLNREYELSHEAKLILIGNGRVGKTCVLKRLFYNTYQAGEGSTHGIALYAQEFDWIDEPYKVKLNSWDFGGQELYHATHRLFMQSRAVYLAVWDYKAEYEESEKFDEDSGFTFRNHPIHYWLENARSLSPHAPILLVQNKVDRDEVKVLSNNPALQERFKTKENYHVSAEKGTRIGVLKEAIREIVVEMPEIGMKVPAQWMRVKAKLLEQKVQKTISQVAYAELCFDEGLSEASANTLLRFLHNTGNLFYHPDLHNEVIILDQEWVLEGIYAIFKRKSPFLSQLYNARGLTDLLALEQPWAAFQPEVRKLFLSMMESCEICFQVTEDNQAPKYLIPECLRPEEPEIIDYVWSKTEANEHRMIYQHDFFHHAFMIRFICRAGRMAKSLDRIWRNGIWITYQKQTQALIRAIPQLHQLEVRVRGQHSALLLFLIHKEFKEIFYDPKTVGIFISVGEEAPEPYYHPKAKLQPIKAMRQDYFKEILNPESEELAKKTLKDIVPPPLKTEDKSNGSDNEETLKRLKAKLNKSISKDLESGLETLQEFVIDPTLQSDVLIQITRYNKLERENDKGKLDYGEYSKNLQQILDAVFSMVKNLEMEELDLNKVKNWLGA